MFLSVGVRAVVNVEALNMVESVGNVTRHRKATVVFRRGGEYVVRIVPVVSGESIAHAYQWWIAELAKQRYGANAPLCEYCEKGEFLKHCDVNLFGSKPWEQELKAAVLSKEGYDPHEVEKKIVQNCIVEDIGGFLFPGAQPPREKSEKKGAEASKKEKASRESERRQEARPVKRTSRFQVSYMVPTLDSLERGAVSVEPQFHVRHSPSRVTKEGQEAAGQAIYYVETGSAVYALTFNIDLGGIGKTSMLRVEDAVDPGEARRRAILAIDALAAMLDTRIFGAKLSRFTPVTEYETVIAAVSERPPFVVSAPASPNFARDVAQRRASFERFFKGSVKLFGIGEALPDGVEPVGNVLDLFDRVKRELGLA
ncbi:MAG: DevR family CRISPR-associated autoregulator [Thermofilaceae archaeon]